MSFSLTGYNLHPSTELCLRALAWFSEKQDFSRVLDMGCGNGILSLTAAGLWDARVLAADISENALADTKAAIDRYHLQKRVAVVRSDGFSNPEIAENGPYDLIICNLVAELLVKFAKDIKANLKPGGYIILGGALTWLYPQVKTVISGLEFEIKQEFYSSPWHALIAQ